MICVEMKQCLLYTDNICGAGLVSVSEWCAAMERHTGLSLPWRMLKERLVLADPAGSGKLRYITTFQDLDISKKEVNHIV